MLARLALASAIALSALHASPVPVPVQPDEAELFHDLDLWNTGLASICLVNGFWRVEAPHAKPMRMVARDDGALIRISTDTSGEETTYRLPKGGEVVTFAGWLLINGSGKRALEPTLLDPPRLPGSGFRKGEQLDWLETRFVELVALKGGDGWHWARQENKANAPGFVLWNLSEDVSGSVRMATGKEREISSAGEGVRIELCEAGSEFPHLEVTAKSAE